MNALTIIFLVSMVGLAWLWLKEPRVRRLWPASRGKTGAKPKLPARL
jgi:hypothetical protein